MAAETTLRDSMNSEMPQRLYPALSGWFGEVMSMLIAAMTPTEAAVAVAASVGVMAAQPVALLQVVGNVGGTVGVKKLLVGPITGPHAVVPGRGECCWDGGLNILFNSVDAITQMAVTYTLAPTTAQGCSLMRRYVGETNR
jgi:hypothetical protein